MIHIKSSSARVVSAPLRFVLRRAIVAAKVAAAVALLAACGSNDVPAAEDGPAGAADMAVGTAAAATGPRIVVQGVDVTNVGHDLGSPSAPIVIVELSDFGCVYCGRHALETLPALEREFVATGKVFYKHVPFVLGMFPNSDRAARAAECAGEQDRFWPMHDSVFVHQKDWKKGADADGLLTTLARSVVPDGAKWSACYAAGRTDVRTKAASAVAARLSVRATPTFFINGQMVEGALPLDVMRSGLNSMLAQPSAP